MDELVALYDDSGRPSGTALRSRMRAENLHHAATAVVVRDSLGRIYVHRRTTTKDVYPGRRDFAAGGVLTAGEHPDRAAERELAEELGVGGVPLLPIGEGDYRDDHTSYHGFCYLTTWDGPVVWQPEEVASGGWTTVEDLLIELDADPADFMPDTVGLLGPWLRALGAHRREPEQGWDCHTVVVEDRWVDRTPRRPEVEAGLLREAAVLPRIADRLPLTVPRPAVVQASPVRLRHAIVPGEPVDVGRLTEADGYAVGEFLVALHAIAGDDVPELPTAAEEQASRVSDVADFEERVLPLLPRRSRPEGLALLRAIAQPVAARLIHADLGPGHLLAAGEQVSGVIDWCDLRLGDPALDLSWLLRGGPSAFGAGVAAAYGVDAALRERALLWWRLAPWWEVVCGQDFLGEEHVGAGLREVVARLG